jgi:hypothetical protein
MGAGGAKAWKQLGGELAVAVDRDFERAVLPLIRILWPQMTQSRGLAAFDKAGVDLVALGDDERIECAVQCKGFFKLEGLADDQLGQIAKSLTTFRRSGLVTDTYILLHNRDGRNKAIAAKIDAALAELVDTGVANRVIQWDRFAFLKAIETKLTEMMGERVSEQSALMLTQMNAQFRYGRTYIPDVPVRHEMLTLERGNAPLIRGVRKSRQIDRVTDALLSAQGRWTLLLGLFGSGKTAAALHAARSSPRLLLYVNAGSLGNTIYNGTNAMMARILDALAIFGDFDTDDRALFGRLASPMLRQLLSNPDGNATLIVDALDENHFLASPIGMGKFASSLAELTCPVVLTTRIEHFRSTFGNFDHLFDELSTKGGNMDDIALLTLDPWGRAQIAHLVAACAAEDPDNAALAIFASEISAGRDGGWPAELLGHPLFLRMIIDLAADGVAPSTDRAQLVDSWIWRKLTRDLKADRALPVEVVDRNAFLEKMEATMQRVAAAMLIAEGEGYKLAETLPSDEVIAIVEEMLGITGLDLPRAIAVSLLVPVDVRFRGSVPIRFSHRAFQEYFLARHIVASELDPTHFPVAVQALATDLARAGAQSGQ